MVAARFTATTTFNINNTSAPVSGLKAKPGNDQGDLGQLGPSETAQW